MPVRKQEETPTPTVAAGVHPGMNEVEAGEGLAAYMTRVGGDDADLDMFDAENTVEPGESSPATQSTESPPPKRAEDAGPGTHPAAESEESAAGSADPGETSEEDSPDSKDAKDEKSEADEKSDDDKQQADADDEGMDPAELAGMLGVDSELLEASEDGQLLVRYRVGDQQGTATVADLLKGYQLEQNVNRKSEQLSTERRELHERIAQQEKNLTEAFEQAQAFGTALKNQVQQKYARVDWDQLRAQNEGQYAALRSDMAAELDQIDQQMNQVVQSVTQARQQHEQAREAQHNKWLGEQYQQLTEHLPHLVDPVQGRDVLDSYHRYLSSIGFQPDEMRVIQDHRFLRVIDDAVKFRQQQVATAAEGATKNGVPVKKMLKRVPRTLKPSSPGGEHGAQSDRRRDSFARLRQSGSEGDAARFLEGYVEKEMGI